MEAGQTGGAPSSEVSDQPIESSESDSTSKDQADSVSKTVPVEDHQRALRDMHAFKSQKKELEKKVQELEITNLEQKEDWKATSEVHKKRAEEFENKYSGLKDSIFDNEKYNAIRNLALKAGIREEAEDDLSLVKLSGVEVESTSEGRMIVHGADTFVEKLKQQKPHWFKSNDVPKFNSGGANTSPIQDRELTAAYMVQLERKNPKQYKELYPKFVAQLKARRQA